MASEKNAPNVRQSMAKVQIDHDEWEPEEDDIEPQIV